MVKNHIHEYTFNSGNKSGNDIISDKNQDKLNNFDNNNKSKGNYFELKNLIKNDLNLNKVNKYSISNDENVSKDLNFNNNNNNNNNNNVNNNINYNKSKIDEN